MLNNLECPAIPALANDYKNILAQYRSHPIDADFEIQVCEIACKHKDCIEDFRFRPEPTIPGEYLKYRSLNKKDREGFLTDNPTFFVKGKVYDYLEQRDRILILNKNNFFTLISWFKLPSISARSRAAIEAVINTYSGKKIHESFNQRIMGIFYKTEVPEEVKQVLSIMGGTMVEEVNK